MTNLRQLAEKDLGQTLEGEFKVPVELIGPDGVLYTTAQNLLVCGAVGSICGGLNIVSGVTSGSLGGQVLYDRVRTNPDTGEEMVVPEPIVVLRRSSLPRVPKSGEKWIVRIPTNISDFNSLENFSLSATRATEGGRSIGFIRLYLTKVLPS